MLRRNACRTIGPETLRQQRPALTITRKDRAMAPRPLPSTDLLRQLLRYDVETGKLYWLERPVSMFTADHRSSEALCCWWNGRFAGEEAGATHARGYVKVKILRETYPAHRIAWKMVHDSEPRFIDHINGNRSDNRLCNLRPCSRAENNSNCRARVGASRFKGVCFHKKLGKWTAGVRKDGRRHHLGCFERELDAARAYDAAARDLHGEFARLNFPEAA